MSIPRRCRRAEIPTADEVLSRAMGAPPCGLVKEHSQQHVLGSCLCLNPRVNDLHEDAVALRVGIGVEYTSRLSSLVVVMRSEPHLIRFARLYYNFAAILDLFDEILRNCEGGRRGFSPEGWRGILYRCGARRCNLVWNLRDRLGKAGFVGTRHLPPLHLLPATRMELTYCCRRLVGMCPSRGLLSTQTNRRKGGVCVAEGLVT